MVVHVSDITIIHQRQVPEGAILTVKLSADEPFRKIRWKRYLRIPGLFDGEHSFEIWENSRRIKQLVHREIFKGASSSCSFPERSAIQNWSLKR
jgi:hypothetical protein